MNRNPKQNRQQKPDNLRRNPSDAERERQAQWAARKKKLENRPIKYTTPYDGRVDLPFFRRIKRYFAGATVYIFFVVVILAVVGGIIGITVLLKSNKTAAVSLKVLYDASDGSRGEYKTELNPEMCLRNDRYYVPVMDILEKFGLIVTGDRGVYTFYIGGSEESLRLEAGSNGIFINGVKQQAFAPIYSDENGIYMPLDYLCAKVPPLEYSVENVKGSEVITVYSNGSMEFSVSRILACEYIDESEAAKMGIILTEPGENGESGEEQTEQT